MAGLVFDASAVISLVDSRDAHFDWAFSLLTMAPEEKFYISALTYAEVLVHPARGKKLSLFLRDFAQAGFEIVPLTEADSLEIANVRSSTNLKTPDAVVVALANRLDAAIASADLALASAARKLTIGVFQPN
jgi:predicted nucleic acid-binding protein